jgi:hypothetical protein
MRKLHEFFNPCNELREFFNSSNPETPVSAQGELLEVPNLDKFPANQNIALAKMSLFTHVNSFKLRSFKVKNGETHC